MPGRRPKVSPSRPQPHPGGFRASLAPNVTGKSHQTVNHSFISRAIFRKEWNGIGHRVCPPGGFDGDRVCGQVLSDESEHVLWHVRIGRISEWFLSIQTM